MDINTKKQKLGYTKYISDKTYTIEHFKELIVTPNPETPYDRVGTFQKIINNIWVIFANKYNR